MAMAEDAGLRWLEGAETGRDKPATRGGKPRAAAYKALLSDADWTAIRTQRALTPRQFQVARLVCEGQSNKEIGAELGLALDTVRMHLRILFDRLEVDTRTQLVLEVMRSAKKRWMNEIAETRSRTSTKAK